MSVQQWKRRRKIKSQTRRRDESGVDYCPTTRKRVFGGPKSARLFVAQGRADRAFRPYQCEHCGWWHLTSRDRSG